LILPCSNIINPEVTLKNEGPSAFTSLGLTPYVDGVAGTLLNWSGNLAPGASTTITFPGVASPTLSGVHNFSVDVSSSNFSLFNQVKNATKVSYMVATAYSTKTVSENFSLRSISSCGMGEREPPNGGPNWTRVNTGDLTSRLLQPNTTSIPTM
jgi:hypothetical protein